MKTVKLDVDLEENYGNGPVSMNDGPHYPEFSFTEDEPCEIPDEGELTVKYRLIRHTEDTKNESKPKYSYTICVKKLVSATGSADKSPTRKYDEAGDALDALAAEKNSEEEAY